LQAIGVTVDPKTKSLTLTNPNPVVPTAPTPTLNGNTLTANDLVSALLTAAKGGSGASDPAKSTAPIPKPSTATTSTSTLTTPLAGYPEAVMKKAANRKFLNLDALLPFNAAMAAATDDDSTTLQLGNRKVKLSLTDSDDGVTSKKRSVRSFSDYSEAMTVFKAAVKEAHPSDQWIIDDIDSHIQRINHYANLQSIGFKRAYHYDVELRRRKEGFTQLWSTHDVEIFAITIGAAAPTSAAGDTAPINRSLNRGGGGGRAASQSNVKCTSYNTTGCNRPNCSFSHTCSFGECAAKNFKHSESECNKKKAASTNRNGPNSKAAVPATAKSSSTTSNPTNTDQ
jgi:hypothetical protein